VEFFREDQEKRKTENEERWREKRERMMLCICEESGKVGEKRDEQTKKYNKGYG